MEATSLRQKLPVTVLDLGSAVIYIGGCVVAVNYFVYLPESPRDVAWGCSATSVGFSRVEPGSVYPPARHPDDHHFTWARGRILQAHQIVFLSDGRGEFEFGRERRKRRVVAGDAFILFPGMWHRYVPDVSTGWVEHWIELRGPVAGRAMAQCADERNPVIQAGLVPEVEACFERCHGWARSDALKNQSLLSTLGLHLISLLCRAQLETEPQSERISSVVARAQVIMLQRCEAAVNVEALAEELHVGYSHFRKAFRAETGVSPKQFHLQLRLQKAQDFLANTDKSLKQVAEILGFNSQFHLSAQFKKVYGVSPSDWRGAVQGGEAEERNRKRRAES